MPENNSKTNSAAEIHSKEYYLASLPRQIFWALQRKNSERWTRKKKPEKLMTRHNAFLSMDNIDVLLVSRTERVRGFANIEE